MLKFRRRSRDYLTSSGGAADPPFKRDLLDNAVLQIASHKVHNGHDEEDDGKRNQSSIFFVNRCVPLCEEFPVQNIFKKMQKKLVSLLNLE